MPAIRCTHVEVYVFRRSGRRVEFLALRRSRRRRNLPGVWQPVTGKLRRAEAALAGARREVLEETGLTPSRWWELERVTTYFDAATDAFYLLPLFAAQVGARSAVKLSDEHDAWEFVSAHVAGTRYLWEAQRLGIEAVQREVLGLPVLARALEIRPAAATDRAKRTTHRARRGTGTRRARG